MAGEDLNKKTKAQLNAKCKELGLRNYSKLNKPDVIRLLVDNGVEHEPTEEKAESVKSGNAKPRATKLSIKLKNHINYDNFENEVKELKTDASDEEINEIFAEIVDDYINSEDLEDADFKKYVVEYDVLKALKEHYTSTKTNILSKSSEEIYKTLAKFVYATDPDVRVNYIKKVRQQIEKYNKAAAKAEALAKKAKESEEAKKSKSSKSSKNPDRKAKTKAKKAISESDEEEPEEEPEESEEESEEE